MDALIDPRTSPFSSREEILREIAEIELMPASRGRDEAIAMMRRWLEEPAKAA